MGIGGNHDPESGHRIDWHATMEDVVSAERMDANRKRTFKMVL